MIHLIKILKSCNIGNYYKKTQKGILDTAEFIYLFLHTLQRASLNSGKTLALVIRKHKFWNVYGSFIKNERQKSAE